VSVRFAEMPRSLEMLDLLWPRVQQFARWTVADGFDTKEALAQAMVAPGSVYYLAYEGDAVEPCGYLSAHPDRPWSAVVHALFFDLRTRGREGQTRRLLEHVMRKNNWPLMRTYEPPTHRTTIAWITRMGFQEDGIIRSAIRRGGQFEDLLIFSYPKGEIYVRSLWGGRQPESEGDTNDAAPALQSGDADADLTAPDDAHVSERWSASNFFGLEECGANGDAGDLPDGLGGEKSRPAAGAAGARGSADTGA
jgi:hypothetical protein